jgi:cytochrome b561
MKIKRAHLLTREVLPFLAWLLALGALALLLDALLHLLNAVWIGRYLGIPGVLLILGSFGYSLRKRKLIKAGKPVDLLRVHERMAWAGSLLVLVHAGIHFNAILGWLAVWAMLINVGSGLTGKFLLQRARRRLEGAREAMRLQGLSPEEQEDSTYWDTLTFDAVKQWRAVHFPIALAFGVLALAHIIAVLWHWGWR